MLNEIYSKKKRKILFLLSIFLIVTLAISMLETVNAKDITIGPNTPGGLKKAIETAENGSTIFLKNGVYSGKNNTYLHINKSINIHGLGSKAVLDGEGKNQIIKINKKNMKVLLKNLNFRNGKAYKNSADINVHGGGAICLTNGSLIIYNCTFTKNQAATHGGAISSFCGELTIIKSTFTKNQAGTAGGAISSREYDRYGAEKDLRDNFKGRLNVSQSTFTKNKATLLGGAIDTDIDFGTVSDCTFTENQALGGGAIGINDGVGTISTSTFTKNKATGTGGAIYSFFGNLTVIKSIFIKNQASDSGGAIVNPRTVNGCTFTENQAEYDGGAIYTILSPGSVSDCIFTKNKAKISGGAIHVSNTFKITNTKFKNNIAANKYNAIAGKVNKLTKKDVLISPKDGTTLKPDLTISKISKKINTHTIFIKNIGMATSGKSVLGVYQGNKLIKIANVKAIGAGKTVQVKVTLDRKFSSRIKTFRADATNKIKESNKNNNIMRAR